MNKQNKLVLKAVKSALRVVEAVEKAEESKLDNRFGTSRRPQNSIPSYHGCPEPPTGKQHGVYQAVIDEKNETIAKLKKEVAAWESAYKGQNSTIEHLQEKLSEDRGAQYKELRGRFFKSCNINYELREEIRELKGGAPARVDAQAYPMRMFAGDDTPYVEKLLKPLGDTPRTLVHLKSPELGTETLVVLSPEGETLLKIVKDNSRKFEVK